MAAELTITTNGEARRAPAGCTIAQFVALTGLNPERVAVEHNGLIAPRSSHSTTVLADGDVLEIVHFVGGG